MEKKAEEEDEIVEELEKAAPGAPAPRKRQRAPIDGASGAGLCDDVVGKILARLPARAAVASMALSKHHHRLILSPQFRTLHRRLCPPLPHPHVAYVATAPIRRRPEHDPVSVFHGFHLAGAGLTGNEPMRALSGGRYLHTQYVNTCNGVVLLASDEFSTQCRCTLWNPAVADAVQEVALPASSPEKEFLVFGLGYGRRSDTYKLLLWRKDETRLSHYPGGGKFCGYRKCRVEYALLIHTLGDVENQPRLLTVLSVNLEKKSDERSLYTKRPLYIDGMVYLLHFDSSAILAVDVDDETADDIDLPGELGRGEPWDAPTQLFEMSGRPCVVANDTCRRVLWLLTADHHWEQRCVIKENLELYSSALDYLHRSPIAGVWDCGDVLVLLFWGNILCLYHVATEKMFRADLPHDLVPEWSDYAICWGYKPTLLSPRSIVGKLNCQDEEQLRRPECLVDITEVVTPVKEQDRRKGQKATLDTVCFMELLVRIIKKLPSDVHDVVRIPLMMDSESRVFFSEIENPTEEEF
ncbi:hypothetical protein ACP70R_011053 [Stipagrostis hirtigluma subsp. patula]